MKRQAHDWFRDYDWWDGGVLEQLFPGKLPKFCGDLDAISEAFALLAGLLVNLELFFAGVIDTLLPIVTDRQASIPVLAGTGHPGPMLQAAFQQVGLLLGFALKVGGEVTFLAKMLFPRLHGDHNWAPHPLATRGRQCCNRQVTWIPPTPWRETMEFDICHRNGHVVSATVKSVPGSKPVCPGYDVSDALSPPSTPGGQSLVCCIRHFAGVPSQPYKHNQPSTSLQPS